MRGKIGILASLCAVAALGIAGGAAFAEGVKEKKEAKPAAAAQGGKIQIVNLTTHADIWEGELGKKIIAKFEAAHPDITVKCEVYPFAQLMEVVEVKMKSRLPDFDVFTVDAPLVASYSIRGYLEPMTNLIPEKDMRETFTANSLRAASYNNVIMTAPKRESGMIMVYNKDILKANNIPFPSESPDKRMTWEEFLDICGKVKKTENGAVTVWGTVIDQINRPWNVMPIANSAGAVWLNEEKQTGTGSINSAASIKAMTFYQDLFNKFAVAPKGVNTNEARELFETGKAAFTFGDPLCYARALKKGINVGICPVPAFKDGKPAVGCDSWHMGVNAFSLKKKAGAEFVKFITMGEGNDMIMADQKNISPRTAFQNALTKDDAPNSPVFKLLKSDLEKYAVGRPKTPGYLEWQDISSAAIEDIRNGADVKTSLDTAAAKIDAALKKYTK